MTDDSTPAPAAAGPAAAARQEAARQLTGLVLTLAALPAAYWLERKLATPDGMRQLRMQLAKGAERACATAAGWLWRRAEAARVAYEQERP